MPSDLLLFIHEAVWSCLESLECRAARASGRSFAVCSQHPHETAWAFPSSFRFFKEPWVVVVVVVVVCFCLECKPLGIHIFGERTCWLLCISFCPLVSSCHVTLLSSVEPTLLRYSRAWLLAACCALSGTRPFPLSFTGHWSSVGFWHFWNLFYFLLSFFWMCVSL